MIETYTDGNSLFYAPDLQSWREWLRANHLNTKAVWLIYPNKLSGKPRISYDNAVDEAICWGWIDSIIKKLDEERAIQYFSPRKTKSNWSRVNKERVKKLEAEGRLQTEGLRLINLAKQNGNWTALDEVENLTLPPDLAEALTQNPLAEEYFMAFARTYKRGILEWLFNAKRAETRQARISKIVSMAEKNLKANFDKE